MKRFETLLWTLFAGLLGAMASKLVRSGLKTGWTRIRRHEPPEDPARDDSPWVEVLVWAAVSGIATAAARLLAKRLSPTLWRNLTGKTPP